MAMALRRSAGLRGAVSAAALWLSACAQSPLVKPGDETFRESSEKFREVTRALPREEGTAKAEPDEAGALFIQAEAFYRYRLQLRSRGGLSLAAQALAASTDFAPLSIWAASSEINVLRMQSYNGAIQLYEKLLADHPDSKLVPLTLYRLGWAYRNVSLAGFPQNSETAFTRLAEKYPSSPLAPLALESMKVPYKTQNKAIGWSVIPGAGQIYIGQDKSGLIRLALAAAFAAAALIPPIFMVKNRELEWPGVALSLAGFVGLQVDYTTSYQDAQVSAIEFNENEEKEFEARHPRGF
jgi:hypothetical protein